MSKLCPITHDVALYLDCCECDDKVCLKKWKDQEQKEEGNSKILPFHRKKERTD